MTGPRSWAVNPRFLLRVAGLPIDALDTLAHTRTAAWIERLLDIEADLAAGRQDLADQLAEVIPGEHLDPGVRRRLIALRRDVFNLRRPDPARVGELVEFLPATVGSALRDWLDVWQRHAWVEHGGANLFDEELVAADERLEHLARLPDLRNGILLASAPLDLAVEDWLASDQAGRRSKRRRRARRSLIDYLLRSAAKTSPFSTLTTVDLGTFTPAANVGVASGRAVSVAADRDSMEGGSDSIRCRLSGMNKHSAVQLNLTELAALAELLIADEQLSAHLPVRLACGLRVEPDRLRFVRRQRRLADVTALASPVMSTVTEEIFHVPRGPALDLLLESLGDGREWPLGEVTTRLCHRLAGRAEPAAVAGYLRKLVRLEVLTVPALELDSHAADAVDSYRRSLLSIGHPVTDRVAGHLAVVCQLMSDYPTETTAGRRRAITAIRAELDVARAELGGTPGPLAGLVYEDTSLRPESLELDMGRWKSITDSLADLASIMPIFDDITGARLALRRFFLDRHPQGRADDFLSFAHEFLRDVIKVPYGQQPRGGRSESGPSYFGRPETGPSHPDRMTALAEARAAALALVAQAVTQAGPDATEIVLDERFRDAILERLPPRWDLPAGYAFFGQLIPDGDGETLVVNQCFGGLGQMYSRFAHLLSGDEPGPDPGGLVAGLRAELAAACPHGAVFAELRGRVDVCNLNLHPVVTDYELVCPGETSHRPVADQIPLEDLVIVDDPAQGRLRLRSRRLDREVIPIYLGSLLPSFLPRIQQVIMHFAPKEGGTVDFAAAVPPAEPVAGVRCRPRIRYRDVVLHRAQWTVEPGEVPQPGPDRGASDYFQSIARWRRRRGLPRRVFARLVVPEAGSPAGAGGFGNKPRYVDFDNWYAVAALRDLLRGEHTALVLTEMLPEHDHLWLRHNDDRYVSEFVIELNTVPVRPS